MTEGTAGVDILHQDEQCLAAALAEVPLRRLVSKREVAYAATFLLSDYASYATGASLITDGGRSYRIYSLFARLTHCPRFWSTELSGVDREPGRSYSVVAR